MMQKLDTNGDGLVSRAEWLRFMAQMKQQRGDAFLNSIIRFWENRTQESLDTIAADQSQSKCLTSAQVERIKTLYRVVYQLQGPSSTSRLSVSTLHMALGGDLLQFLRHLPVLA